MLLDAGDLHFLVGWGVAILVLLLLFLFTRWAFSGPGSPERHPRRRRRTPPPSPDDGLLTRIATLSHRESALALRAVLSDAGIRSTVRFPAAHRTDVLVFPEDAERARALAIAFPGREQ
ncbi:hypothetical protein OF117_05325 [Geodermatophilus sp. YIM 151500]|uniref:hypothetical protein n=1 Tax=Geodermatophilus sp. YIM 151500 TaxID=2984531 RepID=UPI0021E36177|nr:hypothetical protein [Geodermatophilus sp. YIM 151500]MCV2488776.1 hypothetical protein [Geodermatophilus sp. YIM 151500]